MSARSRRQERRADRHQLSFGRWDSAESIRKDWFARGMSTDPANRNLAEAAITGLYALVGRRQPHFVWVDSPRQALRFVPPEDIMRFPAGSPESWPVTHQLATLGHELRSSLDIQVGRQPRPSWGGPVSGLSRARPPMAELAAGTSFGGLLDLGIREALEATFRDGIRQAIRFGLSTLDDGNRLCWYGQHEVHWVALFDAYQRLGLRRFGETQSAQLRLWADLARSCGWWWPRDDVCVIAERPAAIHAELVPGAVYGESRLHNPRGPAVIYRDGWGAYAWHGTPVPEWVITDPEVERISTERNVEIRRCAIERLGWDTYIDQAGLQLISTAGDPGNPGCELQLYDLPQRIWGGSARVLLAVNGSVERDGHRRRYGLSVPGDISDPVSAAGWSYGLSGEQYSELLRRT